MKKLLVCLLAALMVASSGVVSYAATSTSASSSTQASDSKTYSISLSNSSIKFTRNGKSSSYDLSKGETTITKSSSGGLSVQFPVVDSGLKKITLGSQATLSINGSIDRLKIDSKVNKDAVIKIDSKASISTLTVDAPCKVVVDGSASTIKITDPDANVIVSDSAKVSSVTTDSKSAISGVEDSKVTVNSKTTTTTTKNTNTAEDDIEEEDKTPTITISDMKYDEANVTFYCDIEDANILVNNRNIGKTIKGTNLIEFTFDEDSPINYTLIVSKEGYKDAKTTILFGGYYTGN